MYSKKILERFSNPSYAGGLRGGDGTGKAQCGSEVVKIYISVDERGEIAALYKGIPQNDIGFRTDVLDNIPKSIGMRMLIRSMSPKVISADEIAENMTMLGI